MSLTLTGYKLYFDTLCADIPCIHSDTIYSMIINALFDLDLLNDEDVTSISFSTSSAFPFYDNFLFFPLPADFPQAMLPDTALMTDAPWFISSDLLWAYFSGQDAMTDLHHSGSIIAEESHPVHLLYPLWENTQRQHARQAPVMQFKEKTGLYFLFKTTSSNDKKMLDAAVRYLCDEGIGAGRSVGLGSFTPEEFCEEFPDVSPSKRILLSLCCPEKDFFAGATQHTTDITWIRRAKAPYFSSQRDGKYCYMMREGSVFPLDHPALTGSIVRFFNASKRLGMDAPIYRFGKPFFLE